MRHALLLLGTLVVLLAAAPAQAATVSVRDGVLRYEAAAGEGNDLLIREREGAFVVADAPAAPIRAGDGCTAAPDGSAGCGAGPVSRVEITLGDQDDTAVVPAGVASVMLGGPGSDQLTGGELSSELVGGPGGDILYGGSAHDVIRGEGGNDAIVGREGDDVLEGGPGADQIDSGDGDDRLDAGAGGDLLIGGAGIDLLLGGEGHDALNAGTGADRLDGGAGDDRLDSVDAVVDAVLCGSGDDEARTDPDDAVQAGCETRRLPDNRRLEPDPAAFTPMQPYPIVRIVGSASGSATRVERFSVRAPAGARITSRCAGRGCPFRRRAFSVPNGRAVVLRSLAGVYRAGARLEVFVSAPDRIGKYTRFVMRRRRAPQRTDMCVSGVALRAVRCGL